MMYSRLDLIFKIFHSFLLFQITTANPNHTVPNHYNHHRSPALLIVAYDSFRADFFNYNITPYMNEIRENETSSEFMKNVFPTKSFPNYQSIVTGVYPGVHGVFAKSLYDNKLKRMVLDEPELFQYNTDIRPLWTLNQMAGGHSGCMMWPGCTFKNYNHSCTFIETCHRNCPISWMDRVDTVINWLIHPTTPANLVLLHIEARDQASLDNFSTKVLRMRDRIRQLDNLTKYIHDQLMEVNMTDHVNVIHLSDHGVIADIEESHYIDIARWLVRGTYAIYQKSPILQLVPTDVSFTHDIIERLEFAARENGHFQVYTNENILDRWHLENNQRIGPIVLVADVNYAFRDYNNLPIEPEDTDDFGMYGYDNDEPSMRAMFFAKGPNIQSNNSNMEPFENIDLYELFCHLLKLEPDPNNGTIAKIEGILIESWDDTTWKSPALTIGITILVIGILIILSIVVIRYRNREYFSKGARRNDTQLKDIVAE